MKKRNLVLWIVLGVAHLLFILAATITAFFMPQTENVNEETSIVPFVLFGVFYIMAIALIIPAIVWLCQTHKQMTDFGYQLPSRILHFLPVASIYAGYKYCEAMERVTGKRRSSIGGLLLYLFVNLYALLLYAQSAYNQLPPPQQQAYQPPHPQQYPQQPPAQPM